MGKNPPKTEGKTKLRASNSEGEFISTDLLYFVQPSHRSRIRQRSSHLLGDRIFAGLAVLPRKRLNSAGLFGKTVELAGLFGING